MRTYKKYSRPHTISYFLLISLDINFSSRKQKNCKLSFSKKEIGENEQVSIDDLGPHSNNDRPTIYMLIISLEREKNLDELIIAIMPKKITFS
jgi:hypothetical protein